MERIDSVNEQFFVEEVLNILTPKDIETVTDVCKTGKSYKAAQEIKLLGEDILSMLNQNRIKDLKDPVLEFVVNSFYYLMDVKSAQSTNTYMNRIQSISRASVSTLTYADIYLRNQDPGVKKDLTRSIKKIYQLIDQSIYLDPMREIFYDDKKSIEVIEDVFGEESILILKNLNQVSKQTAKRWLDKNPVSLINQRKIKVLAVVCYYLRHCLKMNDQEIISWYKAEDHSFNSTREAIFNQAPKSRYRVDQKIRDLTESIGISDVF
jgi:hypothetical protein